MGNDWKSWGEFKSAVRNLLPLDKNRLGLQDKTDEDGKLVPGYISLMIRQGVIDLQRFIPAFRKNHETLYYPADFAADGAASRGVLPPFAQVTDAYLWNNEDSTRYPLNPFPWDLRHELTSGQCALIDNNGKLCIEPDAYKFYVYPKVEGQWILSLNWDALLDSGKSEFADDELVPFPEDAEFAVAEFVKGHIRREVDRDMQAFSSYFHPRTGTYMVARRNLSLTVKERTRSRR